jgi:hypothetical protein
MVKRCPNGTHKNKKTGNCEKKINNEIVRKRCPKGTRKNKKTGNCDNNLHTTKINNLVKTPEIKIKTPEPNVSHNTISRENYEYIKDKYGHMSSWAIWSKQNGKSKSGMDDISFFYNPSQIILNTLNPNIILVGLNISERIDRVFGNFHPNTSKAQDYKTRYAVKDTMFWGAYMTDIIKSFEEKISGNLMKYLSKNKQFEKENIEKFEQELIDIGSINPIIIALGNDSYKILKRHFKNYKIFKVSHYSAYITKEKLRLDFEKIENEIKVL